MENKQQGGSAISETELRLCFIGRSAHHMKVVIQLVCFGLCVCPSPLSTPILLTHFPKQINEFVNMELEFSQEYLKMLSHIAWIYKEETIQMIDAP